VGAWIKGGVVVVVAEGKQGCSRNALFGVKMINPKDLIIEAKKAFKK
jgi:hypothetical protein